MPSLFALDLLAAGAPPATAVSDHPGLVVLGVLVGAAFVAMWRVLLRLLLIALVALVVIGLGVVMSPALAAAPTTSSGTSQGPTPGMPVPTAPDTQRGQTG